VSGADNHSGYSANEEFNFHGSHGKVDDTPQKRLNPDAALERLRRSQKQSAVVNKCAGNHSGACLVLTDLVYARGNQNG
jgi:hypothetical protein